MEGLQRVAVCCNVLQYVAVLQDGAVCWKVLTSPSAGDTRKGKERARGRNREEERVRKSMREKTRVRERKRETETERERERVGETQRDKEGI